MKLIVLLGSLVTMISSFFCLAPLLEKPAIVEVPKLMEDFSKSHKIIVYNNDFNTFSEVTRILCTALGINADSARFFTFEIDQKGLADVYWGSEEDCIAKAEIISSIGITTEVTEAEWCGKNEF